MAQGWLREASPGHKGRTYPSKERDDDSGGPDGADDCFGLLWPAAAGTWAMVSKPAGSCI